MKVGTKIAVGLVAIFLLVSRVNAAESARLPTNQVPVRMDAMEVSASLYALRWEILCYPDPDRGVVGLIVLRVPDELQRIGVRPGDWVIGVDHELFDGKSIGALRKIVVRYRQRLAMWTFRSMPNGQLMKIGLSLRRAPGLRTQPIMSVDGRVRERYSFLADPKYRIVSLSPADGAEYYWANDGGRGNAVPITEKMVGFSAPIVVKVLPPIYPPSLQAAGISGEAMVDFVVDPTGRPQRVQVVQASDPGFAEPAMRAVREWRFIAAERDGKKVGQHMRVPVRFHVDLSKPVGIQVSAGEKS